MKMTKYILLVAHYEMVEGRTSPMIVVNPLFSDGGTFYFDGVKTAMLGIPPKKELNKKNILEMASEAINLWKKVDSEIIKTKMSEFYRISKTYQFWFFVCPTDYLDRHRASKMGIYLPPESGKVKELRLFIDANGNEIERPPEHIDIMNTLG